VGLRNAEEISDDPARQAGSDVVDLSNTCGHVTATMVRPVSRPKVACED
jgi:hypothetical protein